jgi:hypothetical protein
VSVAQLVDLDAEALQQGLLELELQAWPVRRIDSRRQVGELVGNLEGDAGHTTAGQRFDDGRAHGRILLVDRRPRGTGLERLQRRAHGLVRGLPRQAAGEDGVELRHRRLHVGPDPGRIEGEDANRVGARHTAASELDEVVQGRAGEEQTGLADRALLQRGGDALRQREVANLAVEVVQGRRSAD